MAAKSDLKSQTKLLKAASARLKKEPENPDLQDAEKDLKAQIAKTKEIISNDPQPAWDAARAAKIAAA